MQNPPFNLPIYSNTAPPIDAINTPLVQNNQWRLDELNMRLSSRIYPDYVIPQSITPRPIETRQTVLGKTTDPRNLLSETNIVKYSVANSSINDNFICGDNGEPNWFLANIDTETILRNQCFALQKGGVAPQATYIPSSDSELYRPTLPINTNVVAQPYPYLFRHMQFSENRRIPAAKRNGGDTRNQYIMETFNGDLYRNGSGISNRRKNENVFYNIDRASLSTPFHG
jgi:hypothetical protein